LSVLLLSPLGLSAQRAASDATQEDGAESAPASTEEWNQRLFELSRTAGGIPESFSPSYPIGPGDLLEITVYEAPDLNRSLRVSEDGEVALPLIGTVQAARLSPRELELVIQEMLRLKEIMKDPHVNVFIRELQSQAVSVVGAVRRPGVFQVRRAKSLLEILSLAEGLANDAGDTIIVMRAETFPRTATASGGPADGTPEAASDVIPPSAPIEEHAGPGTAVINLKDLLESGDPSLNVAVYPGDIVKVTRAGIVYVVGEVNRPGGYVLRSNENISVLQAIAEAQGLTPVAAKGNSVILRNKEDGERKEIPINLGAVLKRKAPDQYLQPNDIVFVPTSGARAALLRGLDAAINIVTGIRIYRRR
jgi:polysaccharide export outer membrane protein